MPATCRVLIALLLWFPLVPATTQAATAPRWHQSDLGTPAATPPGDGFAQPDLLAEPDWLRDHLRDDTVRVVALTPADEFSQGHIPGAVQIDWPALEIVDTSEPAIEQWQGEIEAILTTLGITPDQTVVVYDGGTLYAARLWWVLVQLGHADVRVLDGGLPAWRKTGGEIATGAETRASSGEPYRGTPQPDLLATLDEVSAALDDPNVVLIDARTPDEYAAGHIPGAVLLPFTDNNAPDPPRRWKRAAEVRAIYEGLGVTPDQRVIPYCSTGVRSAHTYLTLRLLGYENVALFTGSWAEWSTHPELPTATGAQP